MKSIERTWYFYVNSKPDNDQVVIDLRVIAYGREADGIADVKIDKSSGLIRNCWHILTGTATIFSLNP